MKRILSVAMLLMLSLVLCAQEKDVTKFLGIPVDGSKAEMIRKLKAKGFMYDFKTDLLSGEFNGRKVKLSVVTNNDKVWRIMVQDDVYVNERSIQIRFNDLCRQFENNTKYMSINEEQTLSDEEDISYEIAAHKKRYEAVFYQKPATDFAEIIKEIVQSLAYKYNEEELAHPTEEIKSEITELYFKDYISKKSVWFMISDYLGEYKILMYYDNGHNCANGEDL